MHYQSLVKQHLETLTGAACSLHMSAEDRIARNAPDACDVITRAMSAPASINADERSVEYTLATEDPTECYDPVLGVVDEILLMRGAELRAQAPLLADHERYSINSVRGSLRNMRVEGTALMARAYFANDADSLRAWELVRQGHLTDISVGGVRLARETVNTGETRVIDGRSFTAKARPLRVVTRWRVQEGSLIPIGADLNAVARATAPSIPTSAPVKDTSMNFDQWLAARGLARASLTAAALALLQADFDAIQRAGQPATVNPLVVTTNAGDEVARARGINDERARVQQITEIAGVDVPPADIARAVSENWTVDQMRSHALQIVRASRGTQTTTQVRGTERVEITADRNDKLIRAVEDASIIRRGGSAAQAIPADRRSVAADLLGAGPQAIARAAIGADAPHDPDRLFARAVSTYSFPVALGNTLNRSLQIGYEAYPSTAMRWAGRRPVKDFRDHKNIKIGKFGRPEKNGKAETVKAGTLNEEAEGYSADTYAQKFNFTRQDFINDDLGLFDRVPVLLGENMAMNIDDLAYEVLLANSGVGPTMDADSIALFATTRTDGANYINGATTLTSAGLTALKKLLRLLQQNGRPINVTPRFLLVPAALEQTALELVRSSAIVITGTTDSVRGDTNVHQGTLEVIVEPRLDAGTNGTTAFYLAAQAGARAEHLAISFLRGQESPTVERMTMQDPLAMGWLAYHDVGVSAIDWRGIVRSKGA